MADADKSLVDPSLRPFTTFRFRVEITLDGSAAQVAAASFSEVDGLEMSIEPKTIREGGRNNNPVHLLGPVTYGQLTLKRGMTANTDLWKWFSTVTSPGHRGMRPNAEIVVFSPDEKRETVRFKLHACLPVKLKAPALNAQSGIVAIEEMSLVYEAMQMIPTAPAEGGAAGGGG
jgi:phage tail-like protein